MADSSETKTPSTEDYTKPEGSETQHTLSLPGRDLKYRAIADWIVLRKKEKPVAEMFHIAYLGAIGKPQDRPVTFVFNGGPGAASAYLHVGAVGPKRSTAEGHPLIAGSAFARACPPEA